jgi:hypothetical protein
MPDPWWLPGFLEPHAPQTSRLVMSRDPESITFRPQSRRPFSQSRRPIVAPARLEKPRKNPNRAALRPIARTFSIFRIAARRILQHSRTRVRDT